MTTDDSKAALAAALRAVRGWDDPSAEEDAAAILDALPPDWCGHEAEITLLRDIAADNEAEIARLRAALKAGVEIVRAMTEWGGNCGGLPQTLQDRADWWRLDVDPALTPQDAG